MRIVLTVIAGPHKGLEFSFDRHDTFLVGRSRHAHFQLPAKDRYFSRIHFMMELNPPECRLIDMGSHNGTYVNGAAVLTADLKHGDQIRAGHTVLQVHVTSATAIANPATPIESPEPSALPSVPGYELERELGRGLMGVSYQGQRLADRTPVAVKVVQPSFRGSREQIDEFLRSARQLTQLEHPSIQRVLEVGECGQGFYFASEYVAGHNAAEVLEREGSLSAERAVRWGVQMLRALQYAHARQVVHRDIKPTNILVTQEKGVEVVKLSEFAMARVYQAAPFSGLSVTAALLNLASFMPPELLYNFQEANPLADQYSIGAVLYQLLTGGPPSDLPKEHRRRFSSLLRRQYVPLRSRRADLPVALGEVIQKALSRAPNQRFADVRAFRKALVASMPPGVQ